MSETRTILGGPCSYCGTARAIHRDHVVSHADRRRYGIATNDARYHVGACLSCNIRKLTMRLTPTQEMADELNARMTGPRWQVWNGGAIPKVIR